MDAYENVFEGVKKVLVIMPHPDDCELYCGGTVARLIKDGKTVRVIKMTSGERGCRQENISPQELKSIRENEDREAMKALGISDENNIYLDLGDGKVQDSMEVIGVLAKHIRLFQPDLIITTNPQDMVIRFDKDVNWLNHRDHLNTGRAVLFASYPYSRDISFFPEHFKDSSAKSHICNKFLLTDFYEDKDNVLIKVTDSLNTRIKAHACHSSQYSLEDATDSADFFTKKENYENGERYEKFKYVVVD